MEVIEFTDPTEFREFVDPAILRNEARNSLLLGVTGTLIDRPHVYETFHLWAVTDGQTPVTAAALTPPGNLLLADNASAESLIALAQSIDQSGLDLPGVLGTMPSVAYFSDIWAQIRELTPRLEVRLGVHSLTKVAKPDQVVGEIRVATIDDFDLIVDWLNAFLEEADPLSDRSGLARSVKTRLDVAPSMGGTWLWEVEGDPVSLSGYSGPTPNGIRITSVYTPPHARRRGYATALVSAQSAWLLEQGRRFCFLYTNMANPTSNSIYRKIGYVKVGDARRYGFTPMSPTAE